MGKIYAAFEIKTGERIGYESTEADLIKALSDCYKREEYIIKSFDSFAQMAGLPELTDEDWKLINEMLESGELQIRATDSL